MVAVTNKYLARVTLKDKNGRALITSNGKPFIKFSVALGAKRGFMFVTSFSLTVVKLLSVFPENEAISGVMVNMTGELVSKKNDYKGGYDLNYMCDTIDLIPFGKFQAEFAPPEVKLEQKIAKYEFQEELPNFDADTIIPSEIKKGDDDIVSLDWEEDIQPTQEVVTPTPLNQSFKTCVTCYSNFVPKYEGQKICEACINSGEKISNDMKGGA